MPTQVAVLNLFVEIKTPPCLLEGSSVLFSCDIEGLARPDVVFRKDSLPIIPGREGFTRVTRVSRNQVWVSKM